MKITRTLAAVALSGALMACAATAAPKSTPTPEQSQAMLTAYQAAAGEPVNYFNNVTRGATKWDPLGQEHLVVYTRPSTAYLLRLDGQCIGLDHATAISMGLGRQIYVKTNYVTVLGPENPGGIRCRIEEIRPVDVKQVQAAIKALK